GPVVGDPRAGARHSQPTRGGAVRLLRPPLAPARRDTQWRPAAPRLLRGATGRGGPRAGPPLWLHTLRAQLGRLGPLLDAGSELERHGIHAEAPDGAIPHHVGGGVKDEVGRGGSREPGRSGELLVELARSPSRVAEQQPAAAACHLLRIALENPA